MFNIKDLRESGIGEFHANENEGAISLELIGEVIKQRAAQEYGLEISFYDSEIKMGGVFSSEKQECIVIRNDQHPKYVKYVITVRRTGVMAFISTYTFGIGENLFDSGLFDKFGSKPAKRQAELDYYGMIEACILYAMQG